MFKELILAAGYTAPVNTDLPRAGENFSLPEPSPDQLKTDEQGNQNYLLVTCRPENGNGEWKSAIDGAQVRATVSTAIRDGVPVVFTLRIDPDNFPEVQKYLRVYDTQYGERWGGVMSFEKLAGMSKLVINTDIFSAEPLLTATRCQVGLGRAGQMTETADERNFAPSYHFNFTGAPELTRSVRPGQ